MGKVLVIKDADFAKNAIENILPSTDWVKLNLDVRTSLYPNRWENGSLIAQQQPRYMVGWVDITGKYKIKAIANAASSAIPTNYAGVHMLFYSAEPNVNNATSLFIADTINSDIKANSAMYKNDQEYLIPPGANYALIIDDDYSTSSTASTTKPLGVNAWVK